VHRQNRGMSLQLFATLKDWETDRSSGAAAFGSASQLPLRLPTWELVRYAGIGWGTTPVAFKHQLAPSLNRRGFLFAVCGFPLNQGKRTSVTFSRKITNTTQIAVKNTVATNLPPSPMRGQLSGRKSHGRDVAAQACRNCLFDRRGFYFPHANAIVVISATQNPLH
jgi:hypothetical protein